MNKPMLCPNDQVFKATPEGLISSIKIDWDRGYYASFKLDGYRALIGEGKILSRNLKPIASKQLNQFLAPLASWPQTFDGELYSHELTFQEIGSYIRTIDDDRPLPPSLKYHVFDCMMPRKYGDRLWDIVGKDIIFPDIIEIVPQHLVKNIQDVEKLYLRALDEGYEGLILKACDSLYKHGRATVKEGSCFKVKPFMTFDAKIVGFTQGTEVRDGIERTINELGNSVTSKKKEDRQAVEMIANFQVVYNGVLQEVSCSSMTHEERAAVWEDRETFRGKTIEFKGMLVGAKDKIRHPVFIRFREDK